MEVKSFFPLMLLFATACNQSSSSKDTRDIKASIPGVYTRQSEGEFSKALDTLKISPYDPQAGTFIIERKTGFYRIAEGKLQPKEYKFEKMLVVYDETTQQLQDMKTGRLFSFSASRNELLFGTAGYQKIK